MGRWTADRILEKVTRGLDIVTTVGGVAATVGTIGSLAPGEVLKGVAEDKLEAAIGGSVGTLAYEGAGAAFSHHPSRAAQVFAGVFSAKSLAGAMEAGRLLSGRGVGFVRGVSPVVLAFSAAYGLTRALDQATGYGTGMAQGAGISGTLAADAWRTSPINPANNVALQLKHQLELLQVSQAVQADADRRKQEIMRALATQVQPPAPAAAPAAPATPRLQARTFSWRSNAIPPPQLQRTYRPDRPGQPGWGTVVQRSFDWRSNDIPPPHLQGSLRPDRPGQPGWGMPVGHSAPWWQSSPQQRLADATSGDAALSTLRRWEAAARARESTTRWVDSTHADFVRQQYRHDPVRLAGELLSVNRTPSWQQPGQPGVLGALDRLADRLEAQQATNRWLQGLSAQFSGSRPGPSTMGFGQDRFGESQLR